MTTTVVASAPDLAHNAAEGRSWWVKSLFTPAVVFTYFALPFFAYRPVRPWTSTRLYGTYPDAVLSTWFLAWVPHAVAHGLNPLFSSALDAPLGINVAQDTSTPLLGILAAPFALFLNPVARGNLVIFASLPLSATAAYVVLRKWDVWAPGAALAGLLYGFSPFLIGQGLAHMMMAFLPLPPLIGFLLVAIASESRKATRDGMLLGILLAAQFLISAEIFAMILIVAAIVISFLAIRSASHVASKFSVVIRPVMVAAAVTSMLLAYPVWMFVFGARHYGGSSIAMANPYYNDLLSFLHPGPLQHGVLGVRSLSVPLAGNPVETGSYIGIPLVLTSIILAYRSRQSVRMRVATITTIVAVILSLGPHLTVDGHHTPIPLPFSIIMRLPLVDNMLASRFSFLIFLGLAAILAFGIDDLYQGRPRPRDVPLRTHNSADWRRPTLVSVFVLLAIVLTLWPAWPYGSQPARALPVAARKAMPSADPLTITYPYPSAGAIEAEIWQMETGFSFRLMGGYALHPTTGGRGRSTPDPTTPPQLSDFLTRCRYQEAPTITPGLLAATRDALLREHVRLVIVDKSFTGGPLALALFEQVLGSPRVTAGSIAVWASNGSAL